MPVYELAEKMPYEEFIGWMLYFEKRPVDWRHDDRTFKILQTQGAKGKPQAYFATLGPIYEPKVLEEGELDYQNLKNSSFFQKMMSAKNGEKLDIW